MVASLASTLAHADAARCAPAVDAPIANRVGGTARSAGTEPLRSSQSLALDVAPGVELVLLRRCDDHRETSVQHRTDHGSRRLELLLAEAAWQAKRKKEVMGVTIAPGIGRLISHSELPGAPAEAKVDRPAR